MDSLLWISHIILWLAVLGLGILVLALTRQIGLLHERIAPAGALTPTNGPKIGERVEAATYDTIDNQRVTIGDTTRATKQMLLFISPTCPVCKALVPVARAVAREDNFDLIFASDGADISAHQAYAQKLGIERYPYVVSQPLGIGFAVSKLPFAVLIDDQGALAAKGLVNTREHLESLLEAMRTGIDSIQDYMAINHPDEPEVFEPHTTVSEQHTG
ncbi:methylamine dehydrogenase accessory protein MauD [Luminiphilus syltensis NOR5-1B]|uniref:Methylamine dehydrogenase accessory protein MauD n=1 Tax=Luminiphilus syltensis NOR5-1B TaxID=565045 RepID=B8KXR0_9GAMM|nr:methylamine dehydrogenase accessory protein MauD [Luminiphilus syltensis]EED35818.1 methylamine dehydrogenase accessory protein MauD [Luminiphilus syltensis NOR5-1B]